MNDDPLLVERDGGVLMLTLNRPQARNAFDRALIAALMAALREAEADDGVSVVVLTGAGHVFCPGADVKELEATQGETRVRIFSEPGLLPRLTDNDWAVQNIEVVPGHDQLPVLVVRSPGIARSLKLRLKSVEPVGHYALRPTFSDGHDTGIFSWEYLHELGEDYDALWQRYLDRLKAASASRDPLPKD